MWSFTNKAKMEEIEKIKQLLPAGSYERIAKAIGKSKGTVTQFFSDSIEIRVGEKTANNIIKEAKKIIEENSWNGLETVHGEQKTKMAKNAIAA